jgi:serine phosphatase RsbU (regulator of sigma subunit)
MENAISKKFRLTIGRKIGIGFGILITLTLVNFLATYVTLHNSKKINDEITQVNTPSVNALEDLNLLILRSRMYISNWVFIQSDENNLDKKRLSNLIKYEYPTIKARIQKLAIHWDLVDKRKIDSLFHDTEELFSMHAQVMGLLNNFTSYEDPLILFEARNMVEEGDIHLKTEYILDRLGVIVNNQNSNTNKVSDEMQFAFTVLQRVVTGFGFLILVGGVLVAFFTVLTIVRPIYELKNIISIMGRGVMPEETIKDREDEIGEMNNALKDLIGALRQTTNFAKDVGSRKYDTQYLPLSEQDELSHALLQMRHDLKEYGEGMEQLVEERTAEVVRQKEEITEQNQKLEKIYKHVTDSIHYAKRIQNSILPPLSLIQKSLPQTFVLYKPKDIVSGDFYWFEHVGDDIIIASVDCTGHGVPGALMSMIGNNLLNQAIIKYGAKNAALLVDELNQGVANALRIGQDATNAKDGMDISLCRINFKENILEYAGAFNPLYLMRNEELIEVKADKFPIGYYVEDPDKKYTNHQFEIQENDIFYLFTDGYADQFGGPNGKKFMYRQFKEVLQRIHTMPVEMQHDILDSTIEDWKKMGGVEQLDDIQVIGVRLNRK